MLRRLGIVGLFAALALPVALAYTMVGQTPRSALHVPSIQIASALKPLDFDPASLGARRTGDGLVIERRRLESALADVAQQFELPPRAGAYELTPQGIVLNQGTPGRKLDTAAARALLEGALRRPPDADLVLPVVEVPAPPPPPFAIVVRLSELRLDLYEGTTHRKRFVVGTGALRFPTPPGAYHIKSKAKSPSWNNPGSPWARSMPRHIPPGPRNPLGTRAMRLDRGALVIHGTPNQSSVGQRSSHGCIRMYRADVEELFEIVGVGTPVFIIP